MPTADQARIEQQRIRPRITELWWALRPLKSIVRFMQTGAHPDDEISGMLAALAFRDGINLSYACSTRGEGGQNDIGTEAGAALGALRTREMERACDVLGMRMYWHSEWPDDPITDFGFSKSGTETLGKWGYDRTLARFVEIVRQERPDIICPTFLDVPGQHGHHRAMTLTAHEVMTAAADPDFPSNQAPWQVKKLYLPAWSGAGQAYDDDDPPPAATLVVDGDGCDPMTGWTWEQIGQQSRAYHRTQGMGRWVSASESRNWPLHLTETHVAGPDEDLTSGLPVTLRDLAALSGAEAVKAGLLETQGAIEDTLAAFPDYNSVATSALRALKALRWVQETCPQDLQQEIGHDLTAKDAQLCHVIKLALGVAGAVQADAAYVMPGSEISLAVDITKGQADTVKARFDLPEGWAEDNHVLRVGPDAKPSDNYRATYDPRAPDSPTLVLNISSDAENLDVRVPWNSDPVVLPAHTARATPNAMLINLQSTAWHLKVRVDQVRPADAAVQLDVPTGWTATASGGEFNLHPPDDIDRGLHTTRILVNGHLAQNVQHIDHAHTAPTYWATRAKIDTLVLEAALPDVRVGYVGAGNDRVGHWLTMLGANVTDLANDDLGSEARLAEFDSIVIGIFAMRFRPGLAAAMSRLHRWVENGGTLLTLYHRPWDNWSPETTPPRWLEIGQPSLRWRVTDETADVRHLNEHPLLGTPNKIGPEDWAGWVKERGLYFAKSWDKAYVPLIELADPGEAPHHGALLAADIGRGRHVHTSLILHHQMENLVPGAFRLMANLIAKRS